MKNRKKPEFARVTGGVLIQNLSGRMRQIRGKADHLGDVGGVKKDPENYFSRSNFLSGFYSVSRLSIVQIWRLDRTVGG
jgi:hypothetical protein